MVGADFEYSFPGTAYWKASERCSVFDIGSYALVTCDGVQLHDEKDISLFYKPTAGGPPVFTLGLAVQKNPGGKDVPFMCNKYPYDASDVSCSYLNASDRSLMHPPFACSQKGVGVGEVLIACEQITK